MSTETTWSLITFLAATLVALAVYAVQERMERIAAEAQVEALREAARKDHTARVCAEWDRARAQLERDQVGARADLNGSAWVDALNAADYWRERAQEGFALPTVSGPRDERWAAAGDSPVFAAVEDAANERRSA